MNKDLLITVNRKDKVLGYRSREECHSGKGILHRAFSIFIVNDNGEFLIQKRSKYKSLWSLYWSNTCCSHPNAKDAKEEDAKDAKNAKENLIKQAEKRLKEELGFRSKLKFLYKFCYQAKYKNKGSENELCYVLLGKYNEQEIKPNPKEIADFKWVKYTTLINQIKKNPEKFTPWFKKIIKDKRFILAMRPCG